MTTQQRAERGGLPEHWWGIFLITCTCLHLSASLIWHICLHGQICQPSILNMICIKTYQEPSETRVNVAITHPQSRCSTYAYRVWNDEGPCLESAVFVQQQPERTGSFCPMMSSEQHLVHEIIYRSCLYRLENLEEFPEKESMPWSSPEWTEQNLSNIL